MELPTEENLLESSLKEVLQKTREFGLELSSLDDILCLLKEETTRLKQGTVKLKLTVVEIEVLQATLNCYDDILAMFAEHSRKCSICTLQIQLNQVKLMMALDKLERLKEEILESNPYIKRCGACGGPERKDIENSLVYHNEK